MRGLLVDPGPHFSVADVARGWMKGLTACGVEMRRVNLGERLAFFAGAKLERDGEHVTAFDTEEAVFHVACESIDSACYRWWPDVVVIVSGFYIPQIVYDTIRARGHKIVLIHTESPYEDDKQVARAPNADVNVLNDPTNLDRFPAGSVYLPHCYDPDIHYPRDTNPAYASQFCFVGTGYPSRVDFFEQVDWTGIDANFAGNWQSVTEQSPLRPFVVNDPKQCCDNAETAERYCSTLVSANLYRTEAHSPDLSLGWSMGPREVELAACGTYFLRQSRGEGDKVFPMLPTFSEPDEFGDLVHWAITHPEERYAAIVKAQAAITERTFDRNAAELLGRLGL